MRLQSLVPESQGVVADNRTLCSNTAAIPSTISSSYGLPAI